MQETKQFISRVTELREKNLDFLWNDFMESIEKVVNKLTDQELLSATRISIYYEVKKDDNVYRLDVAEVDSLYENLKYEDEDVCLGNQSMLKNSFGDFFNKAKKDLYCETSFFNTTKLFDGEIVDLEFDISKIKIEPKKTKKSRYKIISV